MGADGSATLQGMSSLFLSLSWIWIPITVWAAFAQTVRNAAQRTLTAEIGTLAATLVRFLYGLPLAAAWVLGTCVVGDRPGLVPVFTASYAAWLALGAVMQVAATACVLLAMQERNFILAVAYSKTELLQVALVSAVLLGEWPGPVALAAMAAAMVGVMLLSVPRGGLRMLWAGGSAGQGRLVAYGLASGACFATASVGFRGASLALGDGVAPWVAGGWGVLWAQLLQTVLLGGGVAANARVRGLLAERCEAAGLDLRVPPLRLCTDNGAMIAMAAAMRLQAGQQTPSRDYAFDVKPRWPLDSLQADAPAVAA